MRSLYFILLISCLWACTTDEKEPYDTPFIHIMTDKGVSKVIVKSDVNNINTYSVYLSSKPLTENLEVNYQVIVGDGLKSGVDFELVTKGSTLTFLPGIYDMPIRHPWNAKSFSENQRSIQITIRLTGNNQGLTMGLPGPDGLQRELVIEKQN